MVVAVARLDVEQTKFDAEHYNSRRAAHSKLPVADQLRWAKSVAVVVAAGSTAAVVVVVQSSGWSRTYRCLR